MKTVAKERFMFYRKKYILLLGLLMLSCSPDHLLAGTADSLNIFDTEDTWRKGYIDGRGQAARFGEIVDITVDKRNNVYVADAGNRVIRKIAPDGHVSTFIGVPEGRQGDVNASEPIMDELVDLTSVAVQEDTLYFTVKGCIRSINIHPDTPSPQVETYLGKCLSASDDNDLEKVDEAVVTEKGFVLTYMKELQFDSQGNMYVMAAGAYKRSHLVSVAEGEEDPVVLVSLTAVEIRSDKSAFPVFDKTNLQGMPETTKLGSIPSEDEVVDKNRCRTRLIEFSSLDLVPRPSSPCRKGLDKLFELSYEATSNDENYPSLVKDSEDNIYFLTDYITRLDLNGDVKRLGKLPKRRGSIHAFNADETVLYSANKVGVFKINLQDVYNENNL